MRRPLQQPAQTPHMLQFGGQQVVTPPGRKILGFKGLGFRVQGSGPQADEGGPGRTVADCSRQSEERSHLQPGEVDRRVAPQREDERALQVEPLAEVFLHSIDTARFNTNE